MTSTPAAQYASLRVAQIADFNKQINAVRDAIEHTCDGPVTCFVLISRAMEYKVRNPGVSGEVVSNALNDALRDFGFLSPSGEE